MANANDKETTSERIDAYLAGKRPDLEPKTFKDDDGEEWVKIPMLGVANANEVPLTEPGGRVIELTKLEVSPSGYVYAWCYTECHPKWHGMVDLQFHREDTIAFELLSDEDRARIRDFRLANVPVGAAWADWVQTLDDPMDQNRYMCSHLNYATAEQRHRVFEAVGKLVREFMEVAP